MSENVGATKAQHNTNSGCYMFATTPRHHRTDSLTIPFERSQMSGKSSQKLSKTLYCAKQMKSVIA